METTLNSIQTGQTTMVANINKIIQYQRMGHSPLNYAMVAGTPTTITALAITKTDETLAAQVGSNHVLLAPGAGSKAFCKAIRFASDNATTPYQTSYKFSVHEEDGAELAGISVGQLQMGSWIPLEVITTTDDKDVLLDTTQTTGAAAPTLTCHLLAGLL